MAALFYTNHRMNDVTLLFYMWKQAADKKAQEREQQQPKNQPPAKKATPQKKQKAVPGIEIDTELANQEVFMNYKHQNVGSEYEDPSEIE